MIYHMVRIFSIYIINNAIIVRIQLVSLCIITTTITILTRFFNVRPRLDPYVTAAD